MPCGHLRCSSIHTSIFRIEESSAGAHSFIHVLNVLLGQRRELGNIVSFLLVLLVRVSLVVSLRIGSSKPLIVASVQCDVDKSCKNSALGIDSFRLTCQEIHPFSST